MNRTFWSTLWISLLISTFVAAQPPLPVEKAPAPKREMRATWIATVVNIDYPKQGTTNAETLQQEYRAMLDQLDSIGINTVIVQVRPAGDAFYPSELAPWSRYLTGRQGEAPTGNFDPLSFMVAEAHRRGMEFHAWLNPYRATMNLDTLSLSPQHAFNRHRDWLVSYGGKLYFNPGLPPVQDHLVDIVSEIVEKYDIDGIHFDDYFYPYRIQGVEFPDSAAYLRYGSILTPIADWRRSNTAKLVERLSRRIKEIDPHVVFGISPFGVWRNKSQDPRGSDTRAGATTYDDLYADVLQWMERGWIDYVMPQLYWHIGFTIADHATLLQWWSQNSYGRQLFVGHAAYKVGNDAQTTWHDPAEIPRQVDLNRRNYQSQGSAYFSTKSVLNNPLGVKDSLARLYQYPALLPERRDLNVKKVGVPEQQKPRFREEAVSIRWDVNALDVEQNNLPYYFVIYRFNGKQQGSLDDPRNILAITPFNQGCTQYEYRDWAARTGETYTYLITAVNMAHSESRGSLPFTVFRKARGIKRLK